MNVPDYFADIATAFPSELKESLAIPAPAFCPETALPLSAPTPGFVRPAAPKISTKEEAEAALDALRTEFAPFLLDLAPPMKVGEGARHALELKEFQWREESPEDRAAFAEILAKGQGTWETVKIPHYGPPLGKAVTLYRTEFQLEAEFLKSEVLRIHFGGVDYKCQVYLNGLCVGTHEGFFEEFWLPITGAAKEGTNILLVRVENDYSMLGENINAIKADGDKIYAATGLGYDDPILGWHHCPAGMGIWNSVRIETLPKIFIDDLWVRPLCESDEIEIHAEVESNSSNPEEDVAVEVSIYGQNFQTTVVEGHLHRGKAEFVRGFGDLIHGYDQYIPQMLGFGRNYITFRLPMKEFRRWNPESPWLYQLQARLVDTQGVRFDSAKVQFGMRTFIQDEETTPKGKFYLNGREIRLRGANTMGNFERCIMQGDMDQLRDDILLAKLTRLNFIRLTQRPIHREFYDYCDRLGMMIQTDLPLFSTVRKNQFAETARQAGRMESHVRSHPSNVMVSFMNEPRPAAASKPHRFIDRPEMEILFDIAAKLVREKNPDRVIKFIDGDYDPPSSQGMPDNHVYCGWYIGQGTDLGALHQGHWLPVKKGWHYGCGEYGSEGLDSYEVMTKEYPESWRPPSPEAPWNPSVIAMSQSWKFHHLWYDGGTNAAEWIDRSQEFQSWVTGLQTRAFRILEGMNTFAIHLFIDAWPAGWMKTIMDVHRVPKKAWFTYRDCLAERAVFLRTDRVHAWAGETIPVDVWVCNDRDETLDGASLSYEVLLDGKPIGCGTAPASAPACAPRGQGRLSIAVPTVTSRATLTVAATLLDEQGKPIHDHTIAINVFPQEAAPALSVHVPSGDAATQEFVRQLGLDPAPTATAGTPMLIESLASYRAHQASIDDHVAKGGLAVLLTIEPGTHRFGSREVTITKAGMGPRHFVSRNTGHPLVEGFQSNDFRFWYHAGVGRVAPILYSVIDSEDGTPILNTGNGSWFKGWESCPAVADFADGKGHWRACQLELRDFIAHNPAAMIFGRRLFTGQA